MATHSSILAWRIPWTEKPGRLHKESDWRRLSLAQGHFLEIKPCLPVIQDSASLLHLIEPEHQVMCFNSMDMSLSKLQETVKDREAWPTVAHGVASDCPIGDSRKARGQSQPSPRTVSGLHVCPSLSVLSSRPAPWRLLSEPSPWQ